MGNGYSDKAVQILYVDFVCLGFFVSFLLFRIFVGFCFCFLRETQIQIQVVLELTIQLSITLSSNLFLSTFEFWSYSMQ